MTADPQLVGRAFVKELDMSQVDREDRTMVRDIIWGVVTFEDPMPKLDITIYGTGDHYNITFAGWCSRIDDAVWYETFLNEDVRAAVYDPIIRTQTIPASENDGVTVKLIKVRKVGATALTKSKRR